MMPSKLVLTNLTLTPITAPRALPRSGSMPSIDLPFEPMNSFGAYVASVATTIVFDLNFAGTSAAILLSVAGVVIVVALVVVAAVVVVLEAFLPLPPQPAARATTRARNPSPATDGIFWRCMLGSFPPRKPGPRLGGVAERIVLPRLEDFREIKQSASLTGPGSLGTAPSPTSRSAASPRPG